MERPNLDNLTPEQAAYVAYLEGRCNGAGNLIGELNLLADLYAKDLMLIRTKKDGPEGKNLTFMKEGKGFERSLVLMDKVKTFKELQKASQPEPVATAKAPAEAKEEAKPSPAQRVNIQDLVLKK